MSDTPEPDRRHSDDRILDAVNGLSDRLLSTERGLNRQLEGVRQKQERQLAVVLSIQENKTIEKTNELWTTMTELKTVYETAKAVGARLAKFTAWGCGTFLALGALFVAAYAAGLIHFR